jgi:hypothetical protein
VTRSACSDCQIDREIFHTISPEVIVLVTQWARDPMVPGAEPFNTDNREKRTVRAAQIAEAGMRGFNPAHRIHWKREEVCATLPAICGECEQY